MSVTILRPPAVLGAVEAMRLRDTFELMVEVCGTGVIVDLTGVQELSAAGLAAVTNFLAQGRRIGTPIRVLLPEAGTGAAALSTRRTSGDSSLREACGTPCPPRLARVNR